MAKIAHARRQAAYRKRRAKRVTHPGPDSLPPPPMVLALVARLTVEAPSAAPRSLFHESYASQTFRCSFCPRRSDYIRAETLAKLPRDARPFRARGPP
jgi:hypothetical protein